MLKHDIHPAYPVPGGVLRQGYADLAEHIHACGGLWLCDGASSASWEAFVDGLKTAAADIATLSIQPAHIGAEASQALLQPFLETSDPSYGRFYDGNLADFFDSSALEQLAGRAQRLLEGGSTVVVYGTGSSLLPLPGHTLWLDLPYESMHILAEEGAAPTLGGFAPLSEKILTNVDFPMLDRQRASLLPALELYVDFRNHQQPVSLAGASLRENLQKLARAPFRVRPAIYTSMWGGHYLVGQVAAMRDFPRCSHYYSLFPPVNSILLEGDGLQVELPFELLMQQESEAVLGQDLAQAFGARMPVRFTLMDTIGGMNLSHQIHPNRQKARKFFNTDFDEPETYFVLTTADGARVNLGLRDDADPQAFRRAVERAQNEQIGFELADFVNSFETKPGQAIHVPSGMVHNAGANNLILEVTTHPLGHTYRIYDYMRRTSDGKLRPLHVEQAFACLDEQRNTSWIKEKSLFSQPRPVAEGPGWKVRRLTSPSLTAYVNDEITFEKEYAASTGGQRFHLLLAVEGDDLRVEGQGFSHPLHQYELLIIPAAAGDYRLVNEDPAGKSCRVFQVYVTTPADYRSAEL